MTFSIVATDGESIGIGTVSGSVGVGKRVPWVKEGVGAIATQGYTETGYGNYGLEFLENGLSSRAVLQKLIREDPSPERRQVAILKPSGEKAIHTGGSCPEKRHSLSAGNCISLGNMLRNEETVSAMIENFSGREGLVLRLLRALEAGADAGGDRRGNRTAALVVKGVEDFDIGIEESDNPFQNLREEYEKQVNKL